MMAADLEQSVFPAHAGMSLYADGLGDHRQGFPRSRGDEPEGDDLVLGKVEFSPLTRG